MFSAQVIKKILNYFVPDEFCPDPIPTAVLDALDSEVCKPNCSYVLCYSPTVLMYLRL